jgi:hypothetical protein
MRGRRKLQHERVIRTTITFHPKVWELAQFRVRELGYPDFSGYLSELIRQEARAGVKLEQAAVTSAA